jgi:tetratricopeptide (TPR) repeat protein
MGRHEDAVREAKRALEIDSLSLIINVLLGYTYYFDRRYDLGIDHLRKTIDLDPHFPLAHLCLGLCYEQVERFQDAIAEFQKVFTVGRRSAIFSVPSPRLRTFRQEAGSAE